MPPAAQPAIAPLRVASARDLGVLFARNPHRMVGQDGAFSIPLEPGRTLWFFGDTLTGRRPPAGQHASGISVPHQVSVLGYDDTLAARYAVPALASVHVPTRDMARAALRHLLHLCYGLEDAAQEQPAPRVMLRASLGRISGAGRR
jgi:hypothetical protein